MCLLQIILLFSAGQGGRYTKRLAYTYNVVILVRFMISSGISATKLRLNTFLLPQIIRAFLKTWIITKPSLPSFHIFNILFPHFRLLSEPYSSITWQIVSSQLHVIKGAVSKFHDSQGSVLRFQREIPSFLAITFKESTVKTKHSDIKDEKHN